MKHLLQIFTLLIAVFIASYSNAQNENFRSRSSFGFQIGGSYYIGDLNQFGHFKHTNLSGGIIYKYHVNSRLEIRGGLRYGKIEGYDSEAKDEVQQARNLSFQTHLWELGAGVEFNFLDYKLGNDRYFISPYMFVELGVFRMNPKTELNGELVALQPIGTEGQGSSLSEKKPYSLIQMAVPFGVGLKMNLGKRAAISVEYGIRLTFTDYLDDVGKGDFIDRGELAAQNGNIAADLSDRSLEEYKMMGERGNPATRDWYSMFGLTISFSLGKSDNCYYQ